MARATAAQSLNCPRCGARIHVADDQCVSCGAALDQGELRERQGDGWRAARPAEWLDYFLKLGLPVIVIALVLALVAFAEALPDAISAPMTPAGPILFLGIVGGLMWYGVWGAKRCSRGQGSLVGPCLAFGVVGVALCTVLFYGIAYAVGRILMRG